MFAGHLRDIETADLDHKFEQFNVSSEVLYQSKLGYSFNLSK